MNVLSLFKPIKAFVFDVDGVLTDGTLFLMADGEMVRRMNIKDGYALQLAVKKGYHVFVISGGKSDPAKQRLEKLGVHAVHMQVHNKTEVLQQLMHQHQLEKSQVLYMGDDMPDLDVMMHTGLPCCPVDACTEIKQISLYLSPFKGGEGCVRDVIEKVLKLNDDWHHTTAIQSR